MASLRFLMYSSIVLACFMNVLDLSFLNSLFPLNHKKRVKTTRSLGGELFGLGGEL